MEEDAAREPDGILAHLSGLKLEQAESTDLSIHEADGESFSEVLVRFESITDRVDSLYKLATRIRNPATRQYRSTAELYRHVPAEKRMAYMREREDIETLIVEHFLTEDFLNQLQFSQASLPAASTVDDFAVVRDRHALIEHVPPKLLRRVGVANARRRQQFIYWREHAERLVSVRSPLLNQITSMPASAATETRQQDSFLPKEGARSKHGTHPSGPTSASPYNRRPGQLGTTNSVRSRSSGISSTPSIGNGLLNWPVTPKTVLAQNYFDCPYCKVICPSQYAQQKCWR